jgi:arginase
MMTEGGMMQDRQSRGGDSRGLCRLVGIPVQEGAGRRGCDMGPSAYRAAEIVDVLGELGWTVEDLGNLGPDPAAVVTHDNPALKHLPTIVAWTRSIAAAAYAASDGAFPIFMGGDHSLSAGTLSGLSRRARHAARPLYVLWLDAHADFHTLETTTSGNLHGVPVAYAVGVPGFEGVYPQNEEPLSAARICMLGTRSVDPAERAALRHAGVTIWDMRSIDERGIVACVRDFLALVSAENGLLHVSLDVDFLDPDIAPGVGTTVPGGITFREAHLVMELLHESRLVCSLDLAELNPYLDDRGRTARLMVDLVASLMGRQIL